MRHRKPAVFGALLALTVLRVEAQEQFPVLPVEMFGCTYRNGQTLADLDPANDAFNEWADDAGITQLTSLMLSPHYFSPELEFDVIGMDIWDSGAALGSGVAQIMNDDSSVAEYNDVVECQTHALFALVGVKPPAAEASIDGGLMEFSDCTIRENRSVEEAIAAVATISGMWTPWNVSDAHGVLIPVSGEVPGAGYTMKWITYYPSIEAFGAVFDHYASGFVQTAGAIVNPVMQCDISRMYDVGLVREAAPAQ